MVMSTERRADGPRADAERPPAAVEAEQRANLVAQVLDVVAEAAPAERTERRQVLPHLRRGDALALGEQVRGDHALALGRDLFQHAVIVREPADGGFGDVGHAPLLVNLFTNAGRGKAAPADPRAASPGRRSRL